MESLELDLRSLVEHLPYYVVVVDAEAHYVWANRFAPSLRREDVIGKPFDVFTPGEGGAASRVVVERCLATGESGYYEICYAGGGVENWYGCRVVALPPDADGKPRAMILSSDINARREAQAALSRSEARFRCLVEATPDFISIIDAERKLLYLNHDPPKETGLSRADILGMPVEALVPSATREQVVTTIESVFANGEPAAYDSFDALQRHHYHVDVVPFHESADSSARAMLVAREVTREREVARHRETMLAELDHRVKNTLAMVLAMAEQTLSRADSLASFREAFMGRLHSLARTHEALASARWSEVQLRDVVDRTLGAIGGVRSLLAAGSSNPMLPARVVTPLSLALHELATNAVKHGALSAVGGTLEVSSSVEGDSSLTLHWRERAPQPAGSTPDGLGLRLVRGLITGELGGSFEVEVGPEQRRYKLAFALTEAE